MVGSTGQKVITTILFATAEFDSNYHNNSFEWDAHYAAAPFAPLKLSVSRKGGDMKRDISLMIVLFLTVLSSAHADVTIQIPDLGNKMMRVTYLFVQTESGSKEMTTAALLFAKSPMKIIDAIEKNTDQELRSEVVPSKENPNLQAIRVIFPNPIPQGGNYKVEVTVEARTENISVDSEGRYVFTYSTGHEAFFVLPKGHAVVYSNYPVLVYERKGNTVLQVKEGGTKELIFKTRAF
jgi:hypothetical protein